MRKGSGQHLVDGLSGDGDRLVAMRSLVRTAVTLIAALASLLVRSDSAAWAARPGLLAELNAAVTTSRSNGAVQTHLVRSRRIPRGGRGRSGMSPQQKQYQKYLQRQQQAYIQQLQAEAAKAANAPPPQPSTGARGRQAQHNALLKRFDANGDGKLSEAERRVAKSTLAKERAAGAADPAAQPAAAAGAEAVGGAAQQAAAPAGKKRKRPK